jgi:hypothetical protein
MGAAFGRFTHAGNHFMHEKGEYVIAGALGLLLLKWQYNKRIAGPRAAKQEMAVKHETVKESAVPVAHAPKAAHH